MPRVIQIASTAVFLTACGPAAKPTAPPIAPIAAEEISEPEPEPEPVSVRRVGDTSIAVGTFNLQWAHDALGDGGPKQALDNRAKTEADWEWKVEQIAKVLIEEKLDIIALQELGGQGEVTDIVMKIERLGGPSYEWAFVESDDRVSGHHVAILSRYPISEQRRFDIHLRRHVAADIELPNGTTATFVAIHAANGRDEGARSKQAKALKRELVRIQKTQPVVVLGTANTPYLPDAKQYNTSSVGLLAGKATRGDTDDCFDSAAFVSGQSTTVHGETSDRIWSCGLEVENVELIGHDKIVRDETDPADLVWSAIPIEAAPYRDVSDHLVLWAEIALPKPPEPETAETATTAAP